MDILLRVFVEGRQQYFSDLCNVLDTAVIVTPLLVDVVYIFVDIEFLRNIPRWIHFVRLLRLIILIRIFHLIHQKRQLEKLMRRLVSENKRRYTRDGFDLDLTYVTERIIAMSFPSSGRQSFYRNPIEESLYYFGERRTDKTNSSKFQGVETPSQNRYVGYFAQVKHLYNWNLPPRQILFIKRLIVYSIRGVGTGYVCDLKVQIVMEKKVVFSSTSLENCSILHDIETDRVLIDVFSGPPLHDDVKVQFFSSNLPKYYDNCPFFFWFNTSFIQSNRLYLPRNELDNPHKQKTWKIYPPQFAVEVLFGTYFSFHLVFT
uniref:C2 tensin-type domain-containing protein n=1 Tax=Piliocolobus tephrosceles TaxID=591936 RepID=A0A8C9GYH5_9PRIM